MRDSYFEECLSSEKCFEVVGDGMHYDPSGYIPMVAATVFILSMLSYGVLAMYGLFKKRRMQRK